MNTSERLAERFAINRPVERRRDGGKGMPPWVFTSRCSEVIEEKGVEIFARHKCSQAFHSIITKNKIPIPFVNQ
jgi:hypothetical protein